LLIEEEKKEDKNLKDKEEKSENPVEFFQSSPLFDSELDLEESVRPTVSTESYGGKIKRRDTIYRVSTVKRADLLNFTKNF